MIIMKTFCKYNQTRTDCTPDAISFVVYSNYQSFSWNLFILVSPKSTKRPYSSFHTILNDPRGLSHTLLLQ